MGSCCLTQIPEEYDDFIFLVIQQPEIQLCKTYTPSTQATGLPEPIEQMPICEEPITQIKEYEQDQVEVVEQPKLIDPQAYQSTNKSEESYSYSKLRKTKIDQIVECPSGIETDSLMMKLNDSTKINTFFVSGLTLQSSVDSKQLAFRKKKPIQFDLSRINEENIH